MCSETALPLVCVCISISMMFLNRLLSGQMSTSSSSSSVPSLDASVTSSATNQSQQSARKTPDSALQQKSDGSSPYITPDFYIIRVTIRTSAHETEGINLYKSIMLSNSERTPQVIRNAMIKHDVEGNTDDYVLAQLLPDGGECWLLPPGGLERSTGGAAVGAGCCHLASWRGVQGAAVGSAGLPSGGLTAL